MTTPTRSINSVHRGNYLKLAACLVLIALTVTAFPTRAAADDAQQAFDNWIAAREAVAKAKEDLKNATAKRDNLMRAATSGKQSAAQEAQLAQARRDVANAEAAVEAAEAALLAAWIALEKAIAELPEDSELRKELKRKRDAISRMPLTANANVAAANDLVVVTFSTNNGKVVVNLPDDMRAGDTISGTVVMEPNGSSTAEKQTNETTLRGLVIVVAKTVVPLTNPSFMIQPVFDIIPDKLAAGQSQTILITLQTPPPQGQPLGQAVIPTGFSGPPQPNTAVVGPDPRTSATFNIPPLGQAGRPLVIPGPFDGNAATTRLSFRDCPLPGNCGDSPSHRTGNSDIIAESPRKAVFRTPAEATGSLELNLSEGSKQTTSGFRNVGVTLSAPKTSLMRGESTTLTVEVNGLEGIKNPVPLTLDSSGVITMQGGMYQALLIQPAQVSSGGRYSTTREITGVRAGAFASTATVVTNRFDVCLQDDSVPARVLQWNSFTGDYQFFCPGCEAPNRAETAAGSGKLVLKGCILTLSHNSPDRRVMARLDACAKSGGASVEIPSRKMKFTITDKNTADNTFATR